MIFLGIKKKLSMLQTLLITKRCKIKLFFHIFRERTKKMSAAKNEKDLHSEGLFGGWCYRELNQGHTDFQSVALPTEL